MSHPHGNDGGHGGSQGGWGGQYPHDHGNWSGGSGGWDAGHGQAPNDGGYGNQSYGASGAGAPHGQGAGAQYGQGAGAQYGQGGGAQYAQGGGAQYGQGAGAQYGPGGPGPQGGSKKPNVGLLLGIAGGVVALVVVIAVAVVMLSGPSEEEEREAAAEGVNATMNAVNDYVSLVQWNDIVCQEYQGSEESLRAADGFLSFLGGYEALFNFELEEVNVTGDDVEFLNEDHTVLEVSRRALGNNDDPIEFRFEDEAWKICDPDIDLRQFDDIDTLPF